MSDDEELWKICERFVQLREWLANVYLLCLRTGDKVMSFDLINVCLLLTGPEQFSLTYQTRLGNLDLPAVTTTGSSCLYFLLSQKDK